MSDKILSVTELTQTIKQILESAFPSVWVEGEISNYIEHTSGHRYFTIKDEGAQLKCVLWKGMSRYLFFEPKNGMKVRACGQISVYEKSGQYQLIVSSLQPAGIGALELAFQQLKAKLEAEGLFDPRRKKKIPEYPEAIGIVTSPTGAAIRDIINITNRRAPWVIRILRPVKVQGDGAAEEIAEAIREFNSYGKVDVLIVGRGGGSLEDLWPFNEEIVARAIFDSKIPVISAVGHEIDFTIADFVADLRAPTPSSAAELAVPDGAELLNYFREMFSRICRLQLAYIQSGRRRLETAVSRYGLRRPMQIVNSRLQALDEINDSFRKTSLHVFERFHNLLEVMNARLQAASPVKIMQRGFAFVTVNRTGEVLKSFTQIAIGDKIDIRLARGGAAATINKVRGGN